MHLRKKRQKRYYIFDCDYHAATAPILSLPARRSAIILSRCRYGGFFFIFRLLHGHFITGLNITGFWLFISTFGYVARLIGDYARGDIALLRAATMHLLGTRSLPPLDVEAYHYFTLITCTAIRNSRASSPI